MTLGLRGKIALATATVLVAAVAAVSVAGAYFFSVEYGAALESRSLAIAKSLKVQLDRLLQYGLSVDSLTGFEEQAADVVKTYAGVEQAMVIARDGTILFHSDPGRMGLRIDDGSLVKAIGAGAETVLHGSGSMQSKVSAVVPVMDRGEPAAVVVVAFPESLISDEMHAMLARQLGVGIAALALGMVALFLMLSGSVTRPVTRLIRSIERMQGLPLLEAQPIRVESEDDIGRMAGTVNRMLEGLKQTTVSKRDLEARNAEISLLSEMSNVLLSALTVEEAYQLVPRFGQRLFPQASGTVLAYAGVRERLERKAGWDDGSALAAMSPEDCWALRRAQAHFVVDPATDVVCPHVHAADEIGAHACVPLSANGEIIGLLHLAFAPGHVPQPAENALAAMLGEQLSFALGNLSLREALREQTVRDPLTGLFNRRYLEEMLEREVARASRSGAPLAVVMLDVDHFKRINDRLGHDVGDQVLRALAREFLAGVRMSDIVCRYGGEEFVILMPDATVEGAAARAEALRARVAALQIALGDRIVPEVTVSAGVAGYPAHGRAGAQLISLADEALYAAKRAGRNRVAVSGALPIGQELSEAPAG